MIAAPPTLAVSEVFGPTFQGEGPSCGRRAAFIRLAGCNLACSWCDTPYTWDWTGKNGRRYDPRTEVTPWTVDRILAAIGAMQTELVVIIGGEPLLQAEHLKPFLDDLAGDGYDVEIETNGTIIPGDWSDWRHLVSGWNVSPKLASANNRAPYLIPDALTWFRDTGRAAFKFVCSDVAALDEVDEIVQTCGLTSATVWIMPEGTTAERVLAGTRLLAEPALARGYNLTTRLHTLLWGDTRGRYTVALERIGRELLLAIGEQPDRDGVKLTPARFARLWSEFIDYDPGNHDTVFETTTTDQMVVVSGMRVWSFCEHHLLPFWADVAVGYIATDRVLGLSKFGRIAHTAAHRLQIQERLVADIAAAVSELTRSPDVAVLARGEHLCMTMRGIRTPARMTTSVMRGVFRETPAARAEFLTLVGEDRC